MNLDYLLIFFIGLFCGYKLPRKKWSRQEFYDRSMDYQLRKAR